MILGLAACGGSGDNSEAVVQAPPPAAEATQTISAANANRVAGEAIHSILFPLNGFNSLVANSVVLSDSASSAAKRAKLLRPMFAKRKVQPQAVVSNSIPCTTNGKSTLTVSQATTGKLSVGDFVELLFEACVQDGVDFLGKEREAVTTVNSEQTIFSAQGEFTGFGDTDSGITVVATGPYALSFDSSNPQLGKIVASSDKAIKVERRIEQKANAAYSIEALQRSLEVDAAAFALVFNISYTASGNFPLLGSTQLKISTPVSLALNLNDGSTKGAIKVVGADGSNLLITFLGDAQETVRLDLDSNGDGTIDQTQNQLLGGLVQTVLTAP